MIVGGVRLRTRRVVGAVTFGLVTAAGFGAGATLVADRLTEPRTVADLRNTLNALRSENEDLRADAASLREEHRRAAPPRELQEAVTAEAERSLALQAAIVDLMQERDRLSAELAKRALFDFKGGELIEILDEDGARLEVRGARPRAWRLRRVRGGYRLEVAGSRSGLGVGLREDLPVEDLELGENSTDPRAVWRFIPFGEGALIINAATGLSLDSYRPFQLASDSAMPRRAPLWRFKRLGR